MKTRTIYIVSEFEHDELYEAQAVFDEKGRLLGAWFCNDANWRSEYFDGFMAELGIVVDYRAATDEDTNLVAEHFGF